MKKMYGVVTPIVTPLTEKDEIDEESLAGLCEYLIQKGIHGLYPNGTTGEMHYLSLEERKRIAEITVQTASSRVPVFVQTGALAQRDTIALAKHAAEIGADGIGVMTPIFFKVSDRAMLDYFCAVARAVPADFPVYLYAIPQYAGNDISVELAGQIAKECPNVAGIKYSYPDMVRIQNMMRVREGDFSVLCGPDELFTLTVCAGGDGTVSGNSQCLPEHYTAVYGALKQKDYERAAKIQQRTNQLSEILCEYDNIAHYKAVLKEEGRIRTKKMRRPMEELSDSATEELMERLTKLRYHEVMV